MVDDFSTPEEIEANLVRMIALSKSNPEAYLKEFYKNSPSMVVHKRVVTAMDYTSLPRHGEEPYLLVEVVESTAREDGLFNNNWLHVYSTYPTEDTFN